MIHLDTETMDIIGKGNKQRTIPLSVTLVNMIRKYLKMRQQVLLDTRLETSSLLLTVNGVPMTDSALRVVFKKLKDGTGVEGRMVSPHTFRRSFGRTYLLAGGDLFSLQMLLGHSDLTTTKLYVQYSDKELAHQMRTFCPLENKTWSYLG